MYLICIKILNFQCIQNCYPDVQQDVMAEDKHVIEKMSKIASHIFTLMYTFLLKKGCLHIT